MTQPDPPGPPAVPPPAAPPPKRRGGLLAAAVVLGVIAAVGIATTATLLLTRGGDTPPAEQAADGSPTSTAPAGLEFAAECGPAPDVQLATDGGSLQVQTENAAAVTIREFGGEPEGAGISMKGLRCILNRLEAPDSVWSRVEQTRALDGRQEASWGGYLASWTYHPDDGVSMVIEQE